MVDQLLELALVEPEDVIFIDREANSSFEFVLELPLAVLITQVSPVLHSRQLMVCHRLKYFVSGWIMHLVGLVEIILFALLLRLVVHREAVKTAIFCLLALYISTTVGIAGLRGACDVALLKFLGHTSINVAATFLNRNARVSNYALWVANFVDERVLRQMLRLVYETSVADIQALLIRESKLLTSQLLRLDLLVELIDVEPECFDLRLPLN